jgi:hypothetical protein
MATSTSAAVAVIEPVFTEQEQRALAGFLAGYTGLTRGAYGFTTLLPPENRLASRLPVAAA